MADYAIRQVRIDYWSATLRDVAPEKQDLVVSRILNLLAKRSSRRSQVPWEQSTPLFGYRLCLRHPSGAIILWGNTGKEGVHVSFPSESLSFFADAMIDLFREFNFSCTRLDLCTDFADMRATDIARNIDCIVSKSKHRAFIYDYQTHGATIYVGSRVSGTRKLIRIYDKAREEQRASDVDRDVLRVEVQLRHEYADYVFRYLLKGGSAVDVLASLVDFRVVSDRRISRRVRMKFWSDFVRLARKRFTFPGKVKERITYERARLYLYRVAARSIALVNAVNQAELFSVIQHGMRKLSNAELVYAVVT